MNYTQNIMTISLKLLTCETQHSNTKILLNTCDIFHVPSINEQYRSLQIIHHYKLQLRLKDTFNFAEL